MISLRQKCKLQYFTKLNTFCVPFEKNIHKSRSSQVYIATIGFDGILKYFRNGLTFTFTLIYSGEPLNYLQNLKAI